MKKIALLLSLIFVLAIFLGGCKDKAKDKTDLSSDSSYTENADATSSDSEKDEAQGDSKTEGSSDKTSSEADKGTSDKGSSVTAGTSDKGSSSTVNSSGANSNQSNSSSSDKEDVVIFIKLFCNICKPRLIRYNFIDNVAQLLHKCL